MFAILENGSVETMLRYRLRFSTGRAFAIPTGQSKSPDGLANARPFLRTSMSLIAGRFDQKSLRGAVNLAGGALHGDSWGKKGEKIKKPSGSGPAHGRKVQETHVYFGLVATNPNPLSGPEARCTSTF